MSMTPSTGDADIGGPPAESGPRPVPWHWFALLVVAIYLADVVLSWPRMDFRNYFFADLGVNMVVQALIRRGLRPTIDFVYQYGLLGLLFGRGWFALFGASPLSYRISGLAFGLWTVASLTRIVRDQRIGLPGAAILLAGLPYFVPTGFPNFVHGLESALLCQCGRAGPGPASDGTGPRHGRRPGQAESGLCVRISPHTFDPPLIPGSLVGRWASRGRWVRAGDHDRLGPDRCAGGGVRGRAYPTHVDPHCRDGQLPGRELRLLLRDRPLFLAPSGGEGRVLPGNSRRLLDRRLADPACLRVSIGLLGPLPLRERPQSRNARRAGSECALLHAAFVCAFFGNAWSWAYYAYVLSIGLAVMTRLSPVWRGWVWILVILAAVGHKSYVTDRIAEWKNRPSAETAGLWASVNVRAEWNEVMGLTHNHRWALLTSSGCCELMSPGAEPPETVFLMPGMDGATEIRRKADQLVSADIIVVPKYLGGSVLLVSWPEFAGVLRGFKMIHDGPEFLVYRRTDQL